MIEIGTFILLALFAMFGNKSKVLQLILVLLTFHSFLKNIFFTYSYGGSVFANWKEIVVLILSIRVITKYKKINFVILCNSLLFILIIISYFLLNSNYTSALPYLRDHIFPILLFLTIYNLKLNYKLYSSLLVYFAIAALIHGIMGFVQAFWLNIPISYLMNRIDFIDSSGYIHYTTSSARILGIERMAGILGGGPNGFGLFFGFVVVFFTNILFNNYSILRKKVLLFIKFVLIISVFSLLLSFSRAGWVLAILGSTLTFFYHKKSFNHKYVFYFISFLTIAAFIINVYFPWAIEVITSSLTGKEESAADRGNNFVKALNINLAEPWGHGIGLTDNRNKGFIFFAESAFMNIAFEIGVFGLMFLIYFHSTILNNIVTLKNFKRMPFSIMAVSISLPSLIISFFSINPYGMPYIYLWWAVLGLGLNKSFLNYSGPILVINDSIKSSKVNILSVSKN